MGWIISKLKVSPEGKLYESRGAIGRKKAHVWNKPTKGASLAFKKGKAVWQHTELGYDYYNVMYQGEENVKSTP
jgi:hypothetical protein